MTSLHPTDWVTVVLVEPAGPLNVGSVARLCKNFGISDLRLVSPRCDPLSLEARRMAVHGSGVLEQARQFSTLVDALFDCRRVVATCGRVEHGDIPLFKSETALDWLLQSKGISKSALVFGREDRGLTNKELGRCQRVMTLQTEATYPSLNLSHAVAVVLHELQRLSKQSISSEEIQTAHEAGDPCRPYELEAFLEDAEQLLLNVGFLLDHTAHARMAKVRRILQRAAIRSEEVSLLRGMVRQLRWAIQSRHN